MRTLQQAVAQMARLETPILLIGEMGTGKGSLAQWIHSESLHRSQGFRKVSCAGATPASFGFADVAEDFWSMGTLYLEELGQLGPACQAALLENCFAADREVRRPRFIASATHPIEEEVQKGGFREDLFFQLNGVSLRLPPLRHRQEDILALAESFLDSAAEQYSRPRPALSAWAQRSLLDHAWPGNLPELEMAMNTLVVLGDEQQALAEIAPKGRTGSSVETVSLKQAARAASREAERELILRILNKTRWNRRKAAEFLQISYKALLYKLKQIGVEDTPSL